MTPPGVFTLSLDFELAWGEFHRGPVNAERLLEARRTVPALLALLERHGVRATFAVVGHLLLEGCAGHPDLPEIRVPWRTGGWLDGDPGTDEARDPCWYAPSLVRSIRDASPGHDVGAHGFSHVPFDEPAVTREVARAELEACRKELHSEGHGALSFVFPRNRISYTEVLAEQGFACYRGVEPRWYAGAPGPVRKVAHMLDQALALSPPVVVAQRRGACIETPGSMLFLSREGFRRRLPMRSRVARATRGLARAAATGQTFHLWMHVEDLVPDTAAMLEGLDAVLTEVRAGVAAGRIEIRTMADQAAEVTAR